MSHIIISLLFSYYSVKQSGLTNLPAYLNKLHVGGKINEIFHNLVSNDECNNTLPPHTPTGVLIIGGMSFIGARLSLNLHERRINVMVTEDILNVDRDPLKWYRWTSLNRKGIDCSIYDYSTSKSISKVLNTHSPQTVVFIPTNLFGRFNDVIWKPSNYYDILKSSLSLLKVLRSTSVRLMVVLPSYSNSDGNFTVRWSRIIERTIASYVQQQHNMENVIMFKSIGVYGPWQDIINVEEFRSTIRKKYIDDFIHSIIGHINKSYIGTSSHETGSSILLTEDWIDSYIREQQMTTKDVVAGATLMFKYCYHCFFFTNSLDYIREWFISAMKYKLNVLLIHNTFSKEFQTRLQSTYHSTEVHHSQCVNKKAATDQRFYILYDYLLNHTNINRILFTDQRDVMFLTDPFKVMTGIGNDYIYVGHDDDRCINSIDDSFIFKQLRLCFPQYVGTSVERELLQLAGCFSSGVLGGSRLSMLTLLSHMKIILETASERVCDMIAVGLPAHSRLYDVVFSLYPFNSGFDSKTPGPFGLAVKHKISMY